MLHVFTLFGFVGSIALPTMEASGQRSHGPKETAESWWKRHQATGHQLVEVAAVAACGTPSKPSKHKLAFLARRVCGKQTSKLDKRGRSSEWRRLRETLPKNEKVEKGVDLLKEVGFRSMEYPKESVGEIKAQIEAGLAENQELETENQKLQAKVSEFEAKNQELETENQKLREEKALALTQAEVEYRLRREAFHEGVALGRQGQAGSTPKPLRVTSDMLEESPNDRIENHCADARRFLHTRVNGC